MWLISERTCLSLSTETSLQSNLHVTRTILENRSAKHYWPSFSGCWLVRIRMQGGFSFLDAHTVYDACSCGGSVQVKIQDVMEF